MSHLPIYRTLVLVSARTLAAARRADWDELIAEQERCRVLVNELRATREDTLSADEKKEKHHILTRLLADDAEIRNLVQPWMKKLEVTLHAAGNERRLGASYGAAL